MAQDAATLRNFMMWMEIIQKTQNINNKKYNKTKYKFDDELIC